MRFKAQKKVNIATLQRVIDDIIEIRSHLDRTQLSRTRYIRLRRYTDTIRLRLQRIIDKTELQTKNHQPRITRYFQTQNSTTSDTDPHYDADQFEDYRGESDKRPLVKQ